LTGIFDVGAVVARSIAGFFSDERIRAEVDRLLELGVAPKAMERVEKSEHPLSGKTVVFTGTLSKIGRKEAEEIVLSLGGKAAGSVSAKTHLVVAGESAGSKLEKARVLGVEVIGEDAFLEMVGEQ
jgi:DNA ligase (NAD+)